MSDPDLTLVHPVPAEEFDAWCRPLITAFLGAPGSEGAARVMESKRGWAPEQRWGFRDRHGWVATLAVAPHRLGVPGGGDVVTEGLTNVSVAGAFRRRGLLTAMMRDWVRNARDRQVPMLFLYAAEWPIYGRFGFAPATFTADYEIATTGLKIAGPSTGLVREVAIEDCVAVAPGLHESARARRHGELARTPQWWSAAYGLDGLPSPRVGGEAPPVFFAHEGEDGVDGYVTWSTVQRSQDHGDKGTIVVEDLQATNIGAYLGLMRSVMSLDLVGQVRMPRRPVDELLRWYLHNGRALRTGYVGDALWLRILDVPAALSARTYASSGRVVLEVRDDTEHGLAAGRFTLTASADGVTCERTTEASVDVSLDQRALAAVYLGGNTLVQMSAAGLAQEQRPDGLRDVDAMFRTVQPPWTATLF